MKEVVKYLTKPWDIPKDKQIEFITSVYGMKRIWPLGGARPEKVISVCPGCGDPGCKGEIGGTYKLVKMGELSGHPCRVFESEDQNSSRLIMVKIDQTWYEQRAAAELPSVHTLSDCAAFAVAPGPPNL
jgi:hypothetical protein